MQICMQLLRCFNMIRQIKQLQQDHFVMNFQEFSLRCKNLGRRNLQIQTIAPRDTGKDGRNHRFSQSKCKPSFVKINKNKLPIDFFKKSDSRRISEQKITFPPEFSETYSKKKIESERSICTPEKTPFFGFFEEKQESSSKVKASTFKVINRKFETREEIKRDLFDLESKRKMTGTSKTAKRELLELFPQTYDEKMADMINKTSKVHSFRPNTKQEESVCQQARLFANPERLEINELKAITGRRAKQNSIKTLNVSLLHADSKEGETNMCITFYNAKSNHLPPLKPQYQQTI